MIRIRGSGKVRLVARVASRRCRGVVVVGMALNTGQRSMQSGQRVIRIDRVIEIDIGPVRRRMACVASRREPGTHMVGICGSLPVRLMASVTARGQRRVVVVRVALRAGDRGMRPRQREDRRVIKR